MLINVKLLKSNKNFRNLYLAQFISYFGSMMTYVAVPYQIYQLTHSSFWVGVLGAVQLLPLLFFGLLGGVTADSMNRRKILIRAEIALAVASLLLCLNSSFENPQVWFVFVMASIAGR